VARSDGHTPDLTVSVDGIIVSREQLAADFVEHEVQLPPRSGRTPTHVTVTVDPAYVPDNDPRRLGAQVDWVTIDRGASWRPLPSRSVAIALLPILALALLWTVAATPMRVALPLMAGVTGLCTWILALGFGTFVPWPVTAIAATVLTGGALAGLVTRQVPTMGTIVAITSAAIAIKLFILLHPSMPIGDAMFHAHRFQTVLAGNFYFTSITPGNYQFPYAPGLYVFSSLFTALADTTADRVVLLRIVTTTIDAVGAAWLAWWLWQWQRDAVMAAGAVVAYHLLPLSFEVITVGNLTNVFAQAVAMMALVLAARERWSLGLAAVVTGVTLIAALSHASTFVLLTAQLAAAGLWIIIRPSVDGRRPGWWMVGAVSVAAVLAIATYYGHFGDVYATAMTRVGEETGRAASSAGFRTPTDRLVDVPRLFGLYYTSPALILALAGAVSLWRSRETAPVSWAVAAASTVVLAAFLILGIITPLDFRHYLAALPLVALAMAAGAVFLWRTLSAGRWVTGAAGLWLLFHSLSRAIGVLD